MLLRLHPGVRNALWPGRVSSTSVLIVADTRLYRDGLALSLARRKGISVVGTPVGPEDVVARIRDTAPDVVLFDVADDGPQWIEELFREVPDAKVIVLGFHETEDDVIAHAEAGVLGFVARDSSIDELVACVRSVAHDDLVFSPRAAAILFERVKTTGSANGNGHRSAALTSRQLEILELVDAGLSNKEIAQRLCIELSTVKNHMHQILDRLQVRSRREAAAAARSTDRASLSLMMLAGELLDLLPTLDLLPV